MNVENFRLFFLLADSKALFKVVKKVKADWGRRQKWGNLKSVIAVIILA